MYNGGSRVWKSANLCCARGLQILDGLAQLRLGLRPVEVVHQLQPGVSLLSAGQAQAMNKW